MIIRDPLTGQGMHVNKEGFGRTYTVSEPEALHVNEKYSEAYCALIQADPSATDADFFYLKNDSEKDLVIYKIKGWLDATAAAVVEVSIKLGVTGSPTAGVSLVPANANAGSGTIAEVTCEQKDGDMALTGGTIFDIIRIDPAAIGEQVFEYPGGIVLKKNATLIFNNDIDPVSYDIDMSVYFYFHE